MGLAAVLDEAVSKAEIAAASFEPSVVSPRQAVALLDAATRLRNLAAAVCTMVAARAAEAGQWRRDGARTEAEWLARRLGTSDGEARVLVETARALPQLPATGELFRRGGLSAAQAAAVTDAAMADPRSEEALLATAAKDSLAGLRKERDRVKAAAEPDLDARYRRIHRQRHLRTWTDADGAGRGMWSTTPDCQAVILAAISNASRAAAEAAHARGEHETSDAYAVDALVDLAERSLAGTGAAGRAGGRDGVGGGAGGPSRRLPPKAIVRIDHAALVRGQTEAGETSEIAGVGPVPVSMVREWLESGDVFLAAVVTRGVDVASVVHLGRRPTAHQVTALQWRDTRCRVECCNRAPTEWDHHEDWTDTKVTRLDALGGLCDHHHDLKTHRRYRITPGALPGKIRLLPPDDP